MKRESAMSSNRESRLRSEIEPHLYKILLAAAVGLLGVGTVVYRILEGWSWVDSFYFSTVAVTTVGFGDLTPSTDASKLFTVAYILSGISIVATFLQARMQRRGTKYLGSRE
jgi:voltage-gated potassium channel Kch